MSSHSAPDSAAAMNSHENSHASPSVNPHIRFLDFPSEIQKDIISHCCQADLICLALASKECRELAASQLYRQFHIVFPDEDDPSFDSPIDGLAGGLDTFVTSHYDYAQHLRDLSLDTLSAGTKGEAAYKPYLFSNSCGKFMNTLLLLTLRKANKLETFKWNIRVELSRPVYAVLHDIKTIANVHIRMQAGPSLYERPPPLPHTLHPPPLIAPNQPPLLWMSPGTHPPPAPPQQGIDFGTQITTANTTFHPVYLVQSQQPPHSHAFAQQSHHPQAFPQQHPHHQPPAAKPPCKTKAQKRPQVLAEPPTLSGFKNLKSLAVLDIETLDIVTEIKTCVRNSAGTLTKLKLSFSDSLASQARRPPAPDVVTDDSDEEESVWSNSGLDPNPQSSGAAESPGAKAHRAQEEKKAQESVLGRIFDVEHYAVKKPQKKIKAKEKTPDGALTSDPGQNFIQNVMKAAEVLMKKKDDMRRDALDIIETAASAYVASLKTKENGSTSASSDSQSAQTKVKTEGESSAAGPSVPARPKRESDDLIPEDIDIEELDGELELDPGSPGPQTEGTETVPELSSSQTLSLAAGGLDPTSVKKAVANLVAQKVNYQTLIEKLEMYKARANDLRKETEELREQDGPVDPERIARTEKEITELSNGIEKARCEINVVEAEVADSQKEIYGLRNSDTIESQRQRRSEYVRTTRGLPLQSLSIYLVPTKASVISKAIDIRMLIRITLLNVGPQAPIWAYLQSQNEESPLPLCKIFTDNVTTSFLQFVSQLNQVTELFMLEREAKYKPESFTPKTVTNIDDIRRLALKKHMPRLRKLMIKNQASPAWDLDTKTIMLLCRRGRNIEELACSMSMRSLHIFNQNVRLLTNLHALHIICLRSDDQCPSLAAESKKFLIDNLTQFPFKNLEWISVSEGNCVNHIKFHQPLSVEERKRRLAAKQAKGKAKATTTATTTNGTSNNTNNQYPTFPPPEIWDGETSTDDGYGDDELAPTSSNFFEKLGTMRFYDVWGVRIFKKEVLSGRL
ncbi:hypothetical protein QBC32DRAFT_333442 [Pseudoneurospora amorphoporcata]|uniref:F-box domain-containing protein n=1 Tax=Pseudoneurospora amorphoporcata TaxID=241081 RepID=A0AAN6SIZ8_9PEZI|nr:hypothetical protein QBC32DRAFT_333442 [Pseudoneurospora amorphoporcata]